MSVTLSAGPKKAPVGTPIDLKITVARDQAAIQIIGINGTMPGNAPTTYTGTGEEVPSGGSKTIRFPKNPNDPAGSWDAGASVDTPGKYEFELVYTQERVRGSAKDSATRTAVEPVPQPGGDEIVWGKTYVGTLAPSGIQQCPCHKGITNDPKKPENGGPAKYDERKAEDSRKLLPWQSDDGSMAALEGSNGTVIINCIDVKSEAHYVCTVTYGNNNAFPSSEDKPLHFRATDNTVTLISQNGNVLHIKCCLTVTKK
ncbi:hypothetical protein EG829_07825 [bacterium]|nr:hypothetical protein [bacterium]